jgi:hypothetical protein
MSPHDALGIPPCSPRLTPRRQPLRRICIRCPAVVGHAQDGTTDGPGERLRADYYRFQGKAAALESWPLRITALSGHEPHQVAAVAWDVISYIKASASCTQIVAGTKFLHHLLPDLGAAYRPEIYPRILHGQKTVPSDRDAFLDWFPGLADIGCRCRQPIRDAIARGGFMATGGAKVIDNAIMGFIQHSQPARATERAPADGPSAPTSAGQSPSSPWIQGRRSSRLHLRKIERLSTLVRTHAGWNQPSWI